MQKTPLAGKKRCKKCNKEFPIRVVVAGRMRNLCNRKFCLECSPFNKHNTKNLVAEKIKEKFCSTCHNLLPTSEFYSRSCRPGGSYSECKKCSKYRVKTAKQRLKQLAVNYKGGTCIKCGYGSCLKALEFHHRDPTKKDFSVSDFKLYKNELTDVFRNELDKCDLLCANCHREVEDDLVTLGGS